MKTSDSAVLDHRHEANSPQQGLLARLGFVARPDSRSLTVWLTDAALLPAAIALANAVQKRFPRTPVVFVQPAQLSVKHGFPVIAAPLPFATAWLLQRLRTQTLVLAGPMDEQNAGVLRAAYKRGASLLRLSRAGERTAGDAPEAAALLDGVIKSDRLLPGVSTDPAPDAATMSLLEGLITRSRKRTMAQRGRLPLGVSILRLLRRPGLRWLLDWKLHEYPSIDALRETLGRPQTILCLGNGPSSEAPGLSGIAHDRLFRVNMSWAARGLLTQPDLVFTGLAEATEALAPPAGFIFGTIQSEEKILGHALIKRRGRLRYATAERLALITNADIGAVAPTNGALMLAAAVALQPKRLIIAGMDLYTHPAGAYPGDPQTANAYAAGHDARIEMAFLLTALNRFRGELLILSDALRDAYSRQQGGAE